MQSVAPHQLLGMWAGHQHRTARNAGPLPLLAGRTARQPGAEQTGAGARARQPDHAGGQSEAGQVHHGDRSQDVRLHLSFGQEEHGAANVSHEECSGGPETRRH